ncbi:MAG: nuclear transport factor 2 family protein [Pseudoclavibacter sp.]|nr:nuclear transport factor 2 family protein [Pseudoclavibacter sp.]
MTLGDIDEVLELEHRGWAALCRGDGGGFYGRLMAPDAVMVLAHGFVLDREAVVASLDGAPPWERYEITGERAVPLGPDAVALVYTARAWRGESCFQALMSSSYRRDEHGAWRLALYQQTPLPADTAERGS